MEDRRSSGRTAASAALRGYDRELSAMKCLMSGGYVQDAFRAAAGRAGSAETGSPKIRAAGVRASKDAVISISLGGRRSALILSESGRLRDNSADGGGEPSSSWGRGGLGVVLRECDCRRGTAGILTKCEGYDDTHEPASLTSGRNNISSWSRTGRED